MRVLVTGASGFIGNAVCAALAQAGHETSALVRRPASAPPLASVVAGDLRDEVRLRQVLLEGRPECVIHLAAEIASQRDAGKVEEVNVRGTRRLLDACLGLAAGDPARGPRFIFASTVVTGEAAGALLSEEEPLPVRTPYGRSKQEGERVVRESGLPAVILRPSHVYGPGGWYAKELVARLRQPGRFAVIGSGRNLWDVVHVRDVADAFVLAVEQAPAGSTYHLADDEPISYYEFMALTADALGVGPPRRIPAAVARLVAGSNAVDAVVRSARSSNAKAKRELGWQLRFPRAREGIADTLASLRAA